MTKIIFLSVFTVFLFACQDPGRGSLTVNLKDGPADLDEINIDLESIEAYIENSQQATWYKLQTNRGIYNILQFQNSSALVATQNNIPEGKVCFVKLILGNNNSVLEKGKYKPLFTQRTPGEKFSVIIPANCVISPHQMSNILLDIDAERSVTKTRAGNFKLHPVAASGVINSPMEIY